MRDNLVQRRSIDILSKLLAEENITVVHDSRAKTASFFPKERKLVFPTYGDQISTTTQIMLSLHETGHATDTPEAVIALMQEYGRSVINILEDVRIEKIVKNKLAGSIKFFTQGYRELVLEHDFFGTARNENPFDFSHFRFLDRVNVHFKLGSQAMVPFSAAEQVLVDKIAKVETLADIEALAKELKELAKKNSENQPGQPPQKDLAKGDESEEEDGDDADSTSSGDEADRDDQESGDSEGSSDFDDDSDDFGDDDVEGSGDSEESDESSDSSSDDNSAVDDDEVEIDENDFGASASGDGEESESDDGEESESDDGEESESDEATTGEAGDAEESASSDESNSKNTEFSDTHADDNNSDVEIDGDDLEDSETESASAKTLEKLATNAGNQGFLPKSSLMNGEFQPWKDIEFYVDKVVKDKVRVGRYYDYTTVDPYANLINFRKEVKPLLNKMISEFNRNSAGTVSRRTAYRDTGVLDPNKMIHYRYNENIFKKRKFVRDGKNHGVCLFVDFTGSMGSRIIPIMRQVVLMVDFCRKINIPFRVYGWSDCYLPSVSEKFFQDRAAIVEIFNNTMPSSVLEKYSAWALTGRGMTPGGSTPLVTSMYKAIPIINKFRKEAKVDVMKFMLFTDGDGHTSMPDWGADSWLDEETGKQYSSKEMALKFYHSDYADKARYSWADGSQRQMSFISDILKDRFNVDTVFVLMNSASFVRPLLQSGRWSQTESKAAIKELRSMKITSLQASPHYSIIGLADGYDILTSKFQLDPSLKTATDRVLKSAFVTAGRERKASTLFATEVAKSLAAAA